MVEEHLPTKTKTAPEKTALGEATWEELTDELMSRDPEPSAVEDLVDNLTPFAQWETLPWDKSENS